MKCNNCGIEIDEVQKSTCPTCGEFIGFPNVREVSSKEETLALKKRYNQSLKEAKANGSNKILKKFEEKIKEACAVVNVGIDFLNTFIKDDRALYANYALQTRANLRKSAKQEDDRHRRSVDSFLFGSYDEEIRFAALSLDGTGLISYGAYALKLREITISKRATLLEKNSIHFVKEHNIQPGNKIPPGYRATWDKKNELVVAKLFKKIKFDTQEEDFAKILLLSKGNRDTDEFIEIHIFGGFDNNAIESVKGKSITKNKQDAALLSGIKDYIIKSGKTWIES